MLKEHEDRDKLRGQAKLLRLFLIHYLQIPRSRIKWIGVHRAKVILEQFPKIAKGAHEYAAAFTDDSWGDEAQALWVKYFEAKVIREDGTYPSRFVGLSSEDRGESKRAWVDFPFRKTGAWIKALLKRKEAPNV